MLAPKFRYRETPFPLRIGADSQTGRIHSASVTAANVHDSRQVNLLHGEETRFYGDSAYRNSSLTDAQAYAMRKRSELQNRVQTI